MASVLQNPPLSEREAFEIGLLKFFHTLEVLAAPSEQQCVILGNYNVAWQLKSDASDGIHFLKSPSRVVLSAEQQQGIARLHRALDFVPFRLMALSATAQGNVRALSDESWAEVRAQASVLLALLSRTIEELRGETLNRRSRRLTTRCNGGEG